VDNGHFFVNFFNTWLLSRGPPLNQVLLIELSTISAEIAVAAKIYIFSQQNNRQNLDVHINMFIDQKEQPLHIFAGTFHSSLQASVREATSCLLCPVSNYVFLLLLSQQQSPDTSLICNTFAVLQQLWDDLPFRGMLGSPSTCG
jgi:hypothetical protein